MVDVRTNLLKNRPTLSEKDYQKEQKYLRWSVTSSVFVVVVVIALSIWNLVLSSQLSKIEQSLASKLKDMQGLTKASSQQIYLKSRLNLVTGFLKGRSFVRESLQKILSINIADTHIVDLSFISETTMSVQYNATNASSLKELLSFYETNTDYFTQVVSRGITRSADGTYQIAMELTMPKDSK